MNKIRKQMEKYGKQNTTVKIRLNRYSERLAKRQKATPTVAQVKLDAVANRCNAITLFAGEYLLAVDGDFTRQLEDAERVCKDYAKRRDVVRVAQAKLADELKKRGQYEKMLDKANRAETEIELKAKSAPVDQTEEERQKMTARKAELMQTTEEYRVKVENAEKDVALAEEELSVVSTECVDALGPMKDAVNACLKAAVKRINADVARLTRKTTKACREGIFEALDTLSFDDDDDDDDDGSDDETSPSDVNADGDGGEDADVVKRDPPTPSSVAPTETATETDSPAARIAPAEKKKKAALARLSSRKTGVKAKNWMSSTFSGFNVKVKTRATLHNSKVKMAKLRGVDLAGFFDALEPLSRGHREDVKTIQKVVFRLKDYACKDSPSGPVPATKRISKMRDALNALKEMGAAGDDVCEDFSSMATIAAARDKTLETLGAECVPALEALADRAEKIVLDFYDVRALALDLAVVEHDLHKAKTAEVKPEKANQEDGLKREKKIQDLTAAAEKIRAELGTAMTALAPIMKGDDDEIFPEDACEPHNLDAGGVADAFGFLNNTGVVATLANVLDDKFLQVFPSVFGDAYTTDAAAAETAKAKRAAHVEAVAANVQAIRADAVAVRKASTLKRQKSNADADADAGAGAEENDANANATDPSPPVTPPATSPAAKEAAAKLKAAEEEALAAEAEAAAIAKKEEEEAERKEAEETWAAAEAAAAAELEAKNKAEAEAAAAMKAAEEKKQKAEEEAAAAKAAKAEAEAQAAKIAEADAAKEAEAETARVTRAQAKAKAEEEAKAEAEAEAASEAAPESPPAPAPVTKSTSKTIPKPRTSEEAS